MDQQKIARGIRLILEGIGENPEREGLKDTPKRFAEMCQEIFEGIHLHPEIQKGFSEQMAEGIISIRDIPFYSVCEHHMLPFFGNINIFYVPQQQQIAGFSSFTKIVNTYARRLQVQERLTEQIADAIVEAINPKGVWVTIKARQLCVAMRGRHPKDVWTLTDAIRGELPFTRIQLLKTF